MAQSIDSRLRQFRLRSNPAVQQKFLSGFTSPIAAFGAGFLAPAVDAANRERAELEFIRAQQQTQLAERTIQLREVEVGVRESQERRLSRQAQVDQSLTQLQIEDARFNQAPQQRQLERLAQESNTANTDAQAAQRRAAAQSTLAGIDNNPVDVKQRAEADTAAIQDQIAILETKKAELKTAESNGFGILGFNDDVDISGFDPTGAFAPDDIRLDNTTENDIDSLSESIDEQIQRLNSKLLRLSNGGGGI